MADADVSVVEYLGGTLVHKSTIMRRFFIRDILWLMVVVGLAVGWWSDRSGLENAERWRLAAGALEKALLSAGWEVKWEEDNIDVTLRDDAGKRVRGATVTLNFFEPNVTVESLPKYRPSAAQAKASAQ